MRLVLATLVVTVLAAAAAQPYRWVDDHGTVHYTDDINKVPPRFRPKEPAPAPGRSDPFAPMEPGGGSRAPVLVPPDATPVPANPPPVKEPERR